MPHGLHLFLLVHTYWLATKQTCSGTYRPMACSSASSAQLKPVDGTQTITKALGKPLLCTRSILQGSSVHGALCRPSACSCAPVQMRGVHACMTTSEQRMTTAGRMQLR
jgi:hypothetical protein